MMKVMISSTHAAYPPDRQDFSSDVFLLTFQADEFGPMIIDVGAQMVIFDDEINEAREEVFIVVLTLKSSTNPNVVITRRSSLCRIVDNDGSFTII